MYLLIVPKMGNKNSKSQQWINNYRIIQTQHHDDNYMVIQDLQTHNLYIKKTIVSNDKNDAQCFNQIINQKINDPSPFVNKLLHSQYDIQQTYCSTKRTFHLFFQISDRSLKQEISLRKSRKMNFEDSEINLVIDNISKGLLYLNKLNQEHGNVCDISISWPINQQKTVQLLDSWSLAQQFKKKRVKKIRSKNQESTILQRDLYSLGLIVLEMIPQNQLKLPLSIDQKMNSSMDQAIKKKLQILLQDQPSQRTRIYQFIQKQSIRCQFSTKQSKLSRLETIRSPPILQKQEQTKFSHHPKASSMILPQKIQQKTDNPQIIFNSNNIQTKNQINKTTILKGIPAPPVNNSGKFITINSVNQPISQVHNIQKTKLIISKNKNVQKIPIQNQQTSVNFQNTNKYKVNFGNSSKNIYTQKTSQQKNTYKTVSSVYNNPQNIKITNNSLIEKNNLLTSADFFKDLGKTISIEGSQNNLTNKQSQIISSNSSFNDPSIRINQVSNSPVRQKKGKQESQFKLKTPSKNKDVQKKSKISTIHQRSQRSQSAYSDQQQKQIVVQYYDTGSKYQGEKINGMRNGQGSYYDGQWKDNKMHGFGRLFYANGYLAYQGEWYIDQFHGLGKVYNDNCTKNQEKFDYTDFTNLDQQWKYYQGSLVSDSKQGFGKIVLGNEEYYEGSFSGDRLNGQGKFYKKDGQVIHGIWKDSILEKVL